MKRISKSFYDWCIENNRLDLNDRFDDCKNGCTTKEVGCKSNSKWWFRCPRGVHEPDQYFMSFVTNNPDRDLICRKCGSVAQVVIDKFGKDYLDSQYGWKDYSFISINRDHFGDNVEWFDVHTSIELDKYIAPETNWQLFMHRTFRTALEKDGENVETYTPLRKVNPADFILGKEAFCEKYKVAEEDFEKIVAAQEAGKTMYVLSYTVTDYKVYDDISWKEKPDSFSDIEGDWDAFVADVVGIRNFDLIEAKYVKDGVTTIIPFVASRTNAVPGITTPNVPKNPFAGFWDIVYKIIMALIILVAIVIVIKIINYIKRKRRERAIDKRLFKK